jgi:hypothetical protein
MNLKPGMNFRFSFHPGSWELSEGYIDRKEAGLKSNLTPVIRERPLALVGMDRKNLYTLSSGHWVWKFDLPHDVGPCFVGPKVIN